MPNKLVGPSMSFDQYLHVGYNNIYGFSSNKLMLATVVIFISLQNLDSQLKHSKENLFIKLFAFQ